MLDPNDLTGVVREDLRYLKSNWDGEITSEALRRECSVLRRLLINGDLQRAWKAAGFQREPIVSAVCLEACLHVAGGREIVLATAGGALHEGIIATGLLLFIGEHTKEEIAKLKEQPADPPMMDMPLKAFMQAPAIIFGGRRISRHRLVKYVANKLGSDHHDTKRGNDDEGIEFAMLDRLSREIKTLIGSHYGVYYELLSIGQALSNSPDIQKFIAGNAK